MELSVRHLVKTSRGRQRGARTNSHPDRPTIMDQASARRQDSRAQRSPLTTQLERRVPLMGTLGAFVMANVVAVVTNDLHLLLAMRFDARASRRELRSPARYCDMRARVAADVGHAVPEAASRRLIRECPASEWHGSGSFGARRASLLCMGARRRGFIERLCHIGTA
jgi:hypothetical protein